MEYVKRLQGDEMDEITVLFVDDETFVLSSLRRNMMAEPFNKLFATSAQEALRIFSEQPVHVVVSDMKMPEMDGLTFLREVKETFPDTVRIVFSGFSEIAQIIPCINSGEIFRYISKPLEPSEFKVILNDAISHYLMQKGSKELMNRLARSYLKLQESRDAYRELSLRDDLTGLYNTRYLFQDLKTRNHVEQPKLAIIFMDIINFKKIVDHHGYINASRVLREVGSTLMEILNEPCYGVSFGGDLFVLVLPDADRCSAMNQVETIKTVMGRTRYLSDGDKGIKLTALFGLAVREGDTATGTNALLSVAEHDLAANKRSR